MLKSFKFDRDKSGLHSKEAAEAKKCRSCLSNLAEPDGISINTNGWESLTFKQMFESTIGYEIMPSEPQHFCDLCVQKLIEWYEFETICQKTQETLMIVKVEPEECHSETIWYESQNYECHVEADVKMESESENIKVEVEPEEILKTVSMSNIDHIESPTGSFTIKFKVFKRDFGQQVVRNCKPLGYLVAEGRNLSDFKQMIWLFIEPHLKREIIFKAEGKEPIWSKQEHPQEKDITRFILFQDKTQKKTVENPSLHTLKSWVNKEPIIFVYPHSRNIHTKNLWRLAEGTLIYGTDKRSDEKPIVYCSELQEEKMELPQMSTLQEDEPMDTESASELESAEETPSTFDELLTCLMDRHGSTFPEASDHSWRMWARYIHCFDKNHQRRLITEGPPTQFLPFFDKELDLFPATLSEKPETSPLLINLIVRLKQTKRETYSIYVGKYTIKGVTVEDINHSIWELVRPYLIREVTFDKSDIPRWSKSRAIPTEEDLHKFITFSDKSLRKVYDIRHSTELLFRHWRKKNVILTIYQFSTSVSTKHRVQKLRNALFDPTSLSWTVADRIMANLKNVHGNDLVSFETSWRMWAHYIQEFDPSEQIDHIKQGPPQELAHLFPPVALQNLKELMSTVGDEEIEDEAPCEMDNKEIFDLLQITKEDRMDQSKVKQCPFEGCSSVLKIGNLPSHYKYCKYNPERKLIYPCRFEGCEKVYGVGSLLRQHQPRCRFNPNRVSLPTLQCPLCPAVVTSLTAHMQGKHSQCQYICDLCGVTKKSKETLKAHILTVHNQAKYLCEKCPVEFKTKKSLTFHITREHSEIQLVLNYKCDHCPYKTYHRTNFYRHVRFNHDPNGKKFNCTECGKAFGTQYLLKTHFKTHSEDNQFACTVCTHVCKTEKGLNAHMTLHEELKYECPVCLLKRRSAAEVRSHCQRKHPEHKLPPKGTIMKKTSKLRGKTFCYYPDKD